MKSVGLIGSLLSAVDDDTTEGDGDVVFRVDDLGDGNRGGDGHDGSSDEGGSRDTEKDVAAEDGTGDGGEAGSHGEVELERAESVSFRAPC